MKPSGVRAKNTGSVKATISVAPPPGSVKRVAVPRRSRAQSGGAGPAGSVREAHQRRDRLAAHVSAADERRGRGDRGEGRLAHDAVRARGARAGACVVVVVQDVDETL
jgi:hypothetical protein